jgi:hypothetical protein
VSQGLIPQFSQSLTENRDDRCVNVWHFGGTIFEKAKPFSAGTPQFDLRTGIPFREALIYSAYKVLGYRRKVVS